MIEPQGISPIPTENAEDNTRNTQPRRHLLRYDVLVIIVTIIWGCTFLVVKDTLTLVGPFTFLFLRFSSGALALALLLGKRLRKITRAEILAGSYIGIFLFAAYSLQTVGLRFTTVSKAGFITALYVPFVTLCELLFLRRRPSLLVLIGVVLSFGGLLLLSLNAALQLTFGLGEWLILACALATAFHIVSISAFAPRMDALNLSFIQVALAALLSLLAIPLAGEPWRIPSLPVWGGVIFMGVVATAFCLAVMNRVQQFISSTRATLMYALEPAWAALTGYLFAGDLLSPMALVGCICIFLGMIMGQVRLSHMFRKPRLSARSKG